MRMGKACCAEPLGVGNSRAHTLKTGIAGANRRRSPGGDPPPGLAEGFPPLRAAILVRPAGCTSTADGASAVRDHCRLIDQPEASQVTPENIVASQRRRTLERMPGQVVVLCLLDGTHLECAWPGPGLGRQERVPPGRPGLRMRSEQAVNRQEPVALHRVRVRGEGQPEGAERLERCLLAIVPMRLQAGMERILLALLALVHQGRAPRPLSARAPRARRDKQGNHRLGPNGHDLGGLRGARVDAGALFSDLEIHASQGLARDRGWPRRATSGRGVRAGSAGRLSAPPPRSPAWAPQDLGRLHLPCGDRRDPRVPNPHAMHQSLGSKA